MRTEERLDEVAAVLGRSRPRLDEITRARVAARVEAELARGEPVAAPAPVTASRRRWPWVVFAAGAAAAAVVAIVGARGGGERAAAIADDPARGVEPAAAAAGVDPGAPSAVVPGGPAPSAVVPGGPAPSGAGSGRIDVAAGESRHIALGDTTITVFGPGHVEGGRDGATADAAAVLVDRPQGAAPWSLRYDRVEVVATKATFALDRGRVVRVTVMRGELVLLCDGDQRTVRAGESMACEPDGTGLVPTTPMSPPPTASHEPTPPAGDRTASARARLAPEVEATAAGSPPVAEPPAAESLPGTAASPPPPPTSPPPAAPPPAAPRSDLDMLGAADSLGIIDEPTPPGPPREPVATSAVPDYYALAEGAMRRGDHEGARAALNQTIMAAPDSLDAALALLDLARLAHRDRDDRAAHGYLARLERHPRRSAVAAPAAALRARLKRP